MADSTPSSSRPVEFWIDLVHRLVEQRFAAALDEHGITRDQWMLLSLLRRGPASREELIVAVSPLSAAAGIDSEAGGSTLAELDELVESEWVGESTAGFVLLPKGEHPVARLDQLIAGIQSDQLTDIDDGALASMTVTLERMARNLGWQAG